MEENKQKEKRFGIPQAFLILASVAFIAYLIINFSYVGDFFKKVLNVLNKIISPVFTGFVIAYFSNPLMTFYERRVFRWKKNTKRARSLCRALSLTLTLITIILILAAIIWLIVPQTIQSIAKLIENKDTYLSGLDSFLQTLEDKVNGLLIRFDSADDGFRVDFSTDFLKNGKILSQTVNTLTDWFVNNKGSLIQTASNTISGVTNAIVSVFIAIYLLSSKELRIAQIKKFGAAFVGEKKRTFIGDVVKTANTTFGNYIQGELIDALLIGILSYIIFAISNISEYSVLMATIFAITNIIPVFGAIIGGVVAGLIVLISNPSKIILYIIFIILIQQFDGNILRPKILGNKTNVSSLCVIIAVSIMGTAFGALGMVIAVPLFATVIALVRKRMDMRLMKSGQSVRTEDYLEGEVLADIDKMLHKNRYTAYYKWKHKRRVKIATEKAAQKKAESEQAANTEAVSENSEQQSACGDIYITYDSTINGSGDLEENSQEAIDNKKAAKGNKKSRKR